MKTHPWPDIKAALAGTRDAFALVDVSVVPARDACVCGHWGVEHAGDEGVGACSHVDKTDDGWAVCSCRVFQEVA
jgi:hypothetical protein